MSRQNERSATSVAPRGVFDAEYVVEPARMDRALASPVFVAAALSGSMLATRGWGGRDSSLLFGICIATGLMAFALARHWRARVSVNGREITWGHAKARGSVCWEDIVSVRFGRMGFRVRARAGDAFWVGTRWTNADAFARAILSCLPSDRIADPRTRAKLEALAVGDEARTSVSGSWEDASPPCAADASSAIARWDDNPFFVLGVAPECSRAEAERAGEKLLSLLTIGASAAKTFVTPFGTKERTAERVRAALAELRDPARRLVCEVWARAPRQASAARSEAPVPWKEAMRAAGWRES